MVIIDPNLYEKLTKIEISLVGEKKKKKKKGHYALCVGHYALC